MGQRGEEPRQGTGDSAALVTELRPALIAFFRRRCGNLAEAEDLAQDVIVRALAHTDWSSVDQARSYIFRIATNRWYDRGRRLQTHGHTVAWEEADSPSLVEEFAPDRVVSSQEELQRLLGLLGELDERKRDILILFRLERMKQAEIAELYGISVSLVEKLVEKALAHLAAGMAVKEIR